MRHMASYDIMETVRNTNQWMGATAKVSPLSRIRNGSKPVCAMDGSMGRSDRTVVRTHGCQARLGINSFTCQDGRDHVVNVKTVIERPFGDLIHLKLPSATAPRKVMLVAPMSGIMQPAAQNVKVLSQIAKFM